MFISFFEEFPTRGNLAKLGLVTWPAKLYIAAPSAKDFRKIISTIHHGNLRQFVYWPILKKEEGYWISPFSSRKGLNRIFRELEDAPIAHQKTGKKVPVMLDLELPTTQNPWLYLTQKPFFFANRSKIRRFLKHYSGETYQCEYFPTGRIGKMALRLLGLHYRSEKAKVIKMIYTSMHHVPEGLFREELRSGKECWGRRFIVGLGVLVPGIMGNEKTLANEQLARDLRLCKKAGVREVIIYRLGGLDKEYVKVLKKFV